MNIENQERKRTPIRRKKARFGGLYGEYTETEIGQRFSPFNAMVYLAAHVPHF